jgi:hypothetical protein
MLTYPRVKRLALSPRHNNHRVTLASNEDLVVTVSEVNQVTGPVVD